MQKRDTQVFQSLPLRMILPREFLACEQMITALVTGSGVFETPGKEEKQKFNVTVPAATNAQELTGVPRNEA